MSYKFTSSFPYLINRVGVRIGGLFSQKLSEHDLTLPMYRVLAVLKQEGPQRLSDLSSMISIELSTLSRLIGTMKARGLISRTRPEGDGRAVRIDLLEEGDSLVEILMPIATHFENVAIGSFSASETIWLKETLAKIYDNLDALEADRNIKP